MVVLQIQHDLGPRAGARHARARTVVRARAILGYMSGRAGTLPGSASKSEAGPQGAKTSPAARPTPRPGCPFRELLLAAPAIHAAAARRGRFPAARRVGHAATC